MENNITRVWIGTHEQKFDGDVMTHVKVFATKELAEKWLAEKKEQILNHPKWKRLAEENSLEIEEADEYSFFVTNEADCYDWDELHIEDKVVVTDDKYLLL